MSFRLLPPALDLTLDRTFAATMLATSGVWPILAMQIQGQPAKNGSATTPGRLPMRRCSPPAPNRTYSHNTDPHLFSSYWEINYIDVYDETSSPSQSSTVPVPTSSRPISSGIYGNYSTTATTSAASSAASSATVSSPGTSSPTPTTSLTRDPANIGDFVLLGCFGSSSRFVTFALADTRSDMTPEVCVGLCAQSKYAGVFDK